MPIRIKCPKCQTILGVKESLAGKKASCPKCRGVLTIPMPKAPVAKPAAQRPEDLEAMALSAFADAPAKPEPVAKEVEFECPFCMEMVKVAANLAGKQTPCPNPECKRIVKVPMPKPDKLKDWRQTDPRAPVAPLKGDNNEELEGAWSTSQKKRVSTEALVEADAIPVKRQPVTTQTWIRRGVLAFIALVVVIGGAWGALAWMASSRREGPLRDAMGLAESLKPAPAANILLGAGQCYTLRNQPNDAMVQFNKARGKWSLSDDKTPHDPDRDTVLIEIALALIDLAGSKQEVDNETRLDWDAIQLELKRTLAKLTSDEARQTALREVGTRLIAREQGLAAVWLAEQFKPQEPAPKIETVLPGAGEKKQADGGDKKPPAVVRHRLDAPHVALLFGTDQAAEAFKILPFPGDKDKEEAVDPIARLAYAEGLARRGKYEAARQLANRKGPPRDRLESSIAVAAIAISQKKSTEAKASAQDALKAYLELDKTPVPVWLEIQLTSVCARSGMGTEVKEKVVDKIPADTRDKEAKALAQAELLAANLEANSDKQVAATIVDDFVTLKDTMGYGLALEMVARHNTRLGGRSAALAMVEGLEGSQQAFVHIGVALGLLEAR